MASERNREGRQVTPRRGAWREGVMHGGVSHNAHVAIAYYIW